MTSRAGQIRLAPSILAADFARLGEAVAAATRGGADQIHVDVMDGHFVPNITIGVPVVKSLRKVTELPLDVHLMISDPDRYVEPFIDAGANYVSVHVEVLPHLHRTITHVKSLGAKAGVVLNPSTPVSALEEIAGDVDFVLVMSVNPGFAGQAFLPQALEKARRLRRLIEISGAKVEIEMDGGIDRDNMGRVVSAGVEVCVVGAAIFAAGDPLAMMSELRERARPETV